MKRLGENRWFLLAAVLLAGLLCCFLLNGRSAGGSGAGEEKRIAQVLSAISGGIHTHLVEAATEEELEAIGQALRDLGVLYKN